MIDERDPIDFQVDLARIDDAGLPELSGVPLVRKKKRRITMEMWAGAGFSDACVAHEVSPRQGMRWRLQDPRFNLWCDIYEWEQEHTDLALIASSVIEAAKEDPRLGLQVLKARHPDWNPSKRVVHEDDSKNEVRTRLIPTRGVVEAEFRQLPEGGTE